MRRLIPVIVALAAVLVPLPASATPGFGTVQNFGPNLRSDCLQPEGIAVDPETGNVYTTSAPLAGQASVTICVLSPDGSLVDKIPVQPGPGGTTNLLGALFVPGKGLYVVDVADMAAGHGRLLKVDPDTHVVATVATGFTFPNGIAQDATGNLFVSDSFQGAIFRVASGGSVTVWSHDPLLSPHGFVGVNDLAVNRDQTFLFADNSDNGQLLRIPVREDGSAGPAQIFVTSAPINAFPGFPDGLMFDVKANLYVCTPGLKQVQVIAPDGRLITSLTGTGANAMDFPASLVFNGKTLYISDFSIVDGGVNSRVSRVRVPFPGLPLTEED